MKRDIKDTGRVPQFYSTQVSEATRFYLDAHARSRQGLAVVCGGCEHCEPDYQIDRSGFPLFSIEFVARGKGRLTLCGSDHVLSPGMAFAYGPGVPHVIRTDPEDRLVKYFVDFTGRKAEPMLIEFAPQPGQLVQISSPDDVLRIFDDLIRNGQAGSRYSSLICATLVQQLTLKIAETQVIARVGSTAAFSTYQACREYIRGHCLRLRTLAEIAEHCHVDEAYLCRLFRRFDDQSPYQYLLRLKMNVAAQRLHEPNTLVKQVAYELGFGDPFHFSRLFRKVYGLSPVEFKRLRS